MNEAETRAEHIDPALRAAGWGVVEGSRIRREYPVTLGRLEGGSGRRAKALQADYLLEYRNTKLAVLEAKPWDAPLTEGVGQAKNYAAKLAVRFTFASNGQGFYGIDMLTGAEAEWPAFPTPEALWALTFATQNAWRDRFAAVPFEDKGGTWQGRYYQGIAFQLAWKLFHSRWNLTDWRAGTEPNELGTRRPRILFLADRNILADQAYNAFSAFPDDALVRIAPDDIKKKGRVPKNGSLFFTIFQTFMSGPNNAPYFGDYPPDFFDFIVIDECHRGGANDEGSWRAILDYFAPAVQLGLTATPKRTINADTYAYFGEPVFQYSLKEGINDGFLTPFKVQQIATTLDDYVFTPDDEMVEGSIDAGRRYTEADFNKIIEIKQIIGRGTRPYGGKDHFTIYDFVKAHHHFNDPEWDGEPLEPEAPPAPRTPEAPVANIKVKLADGKARRIQHMSATSFWSADGRPMSAAQFLESLFGALPEFFKDEDELRAIWGAPDTRKALCCLST